MQQHSHWPWDTSTHHADSQNLLEHNKNYICDPWDASNIYQPGLFSLSHPVEFVNFISSEDFVTPESNLQSYNAESLFSFSFADADQGASLTTQKSTSPQQNGDNKTSMMNASLMPELTSASQVQQETFSADVTRTHALSLQTAKLSSPMAIGINGGGIVPITESFLNYLIQKVEKYNASKMGAARTDQYTQSMIRHLAARQPPRMPGELPAVEDTGSKKSSPTNRKRKRSSPAKMKASKTASDDDSSTEAEDEADLSGPTDDGSAPKKNKKTAAAKKRKSGTQPQRKKRRTTKDASNNKMDVDEDHTGQQSSPAKSPKSTISPSSAVPLRLKKYVAKAENKDSPISPDNDSRASNSDSVAGLSPSAKKAKASGMIEGATSIMMRPMRKVGAGFVNGDSLPQALLAQPYKYLLRIIYDSDEEQEIPLVQILDSKHKVVQESMPVQVVKTLTGRDKNNETGYVLTLKVQMTRSDNASDDQKYYVYIPSLKYKTSKFRILFRSISGKKQCEWPTVNDEALLKK